MSAPDLQVLRSVLYMPSSNARAVEKARTIPADAIIFDLEDAVAPDAKQTARTRAVEAVRSGQYGRRVLTIRCNGLDTPWGEDDLLEAATSGATAVVIPKVSGVEHLAQVVAVLDKAGAPEALAVWAMVETPTAVLDVRAIASADRVAALVLGTNDLAKELRAALVPGRAPLLPHLATTLLAAREAGVAVLDGVYNDVKDLAGFQAECVQGFEMGFDGKTLVHPTQVEVANRVWAPGEQELAYAHRVLAAFDEALAQGRGVATVDGRMIENLHVDNARRTLSVAEAVADLG